MPQVSFFPLPVYGLEHFCRFWFSFFFGIHVLLVFDVSSADKSFSQRCTSSFPNFAYFPIALPIRLFEVVLILQCSENRISSKALKKSTAFIIIKQCYFVKLFFLLASNFWEFEKIKLEGFAFIDKISLKCYNQNDLKHKFNI